MPPKSGPFCPNLDFATVLIYNIGMKRTVVAVLMFACPLAANAETPDEWVTLGARVHGGFGAFIPLGIKIGLDAVKRLDAKPRELSVRLLSIAIHRRAPALQTASPSPLVRQSASAP